MQTGICLCQFRQCVHLPINEKLFVKPITINTAGEIQVDFIRKPKLPIWGFNVGSLGQYIYNSNDLSTESKIIFFWVELLF